MPEGEWGDQDVLRAANLLRTVSCALVLLVHVNLALRPGIETWWPGGIFSAPFFAVPVPAFFMLSGFFSGRFSPTVSRPGGVAFLRKKARSLILPFLLWNLILIALHQGTLSPAETIRYLLTGYWQLYYLFVLLQLMLLHHWCEPLLTERRTGWTFACTLLLAVGFGVTAEYLLRTRGAASEFMESELCRLFLPWAMFYVGGLWLRQQESLLRWLDRKWGWLALLAVVSYAGYVISLRHEMDWVGFNPLMQFLLGALPFRLVSPVLLFIALIRLAASGGWERAAARIASMAQDTYGIYLSHTAVLTLLLAAWKSISVTHWIEVPILWSATWFLSRGMVRLARTSPLPWLGPLVFGTTGRRYRAG